MKKIGIYNPFLNTRGGGEKVCLAMAAELSLNDDYEVVLISHSEPDLSGLGEYFSTDLTRVKTQEIIYESFLWRLLSRAPLPGDLKNMFYDFKLYRQVKKSSYDLFVNNKYQSNLPGAGKKNLYMCMFPQKLDLKSTNFGLVKRVYKKVIALTYRAVFHPSKEYSIQTYDLITANSKYTQKYIMKYWGVNSSILYPICQDMHIDDMAKEKIILHVGRFFENAGESHHKRQDFLIDTFIKLKDLHTTGWQLHLAGSVAESVGTLKYLLEIIEKSEGYPIFFHFNSTFEELRKNYGHAQIYWHATGFGSDSGKHPEKQEHFGISTVEAMSTGAIPVVINAAGQKEVVSDGIDGYLWNTQEDLISKTRVVAMLDSDRAALMSGKAMETAQRYGSDGFKQNLKSVMSEINF